VRMAAADDGGGEAGGIPHAANGKMLAAHSHAAR
jgi:hypothetical protein